MPDPLTQTAVKKLVAAGKPGDYRDARTRGLVLRVSGPDRASWCFRRSWKGKDHRLEMGAQWTLDEARGIVAEVEARLEVDKRERNRFPWFDGVFAWADFISARARRAAGLPEEDGTPREKVPTGPRVPQMAWHDAVERWRTELLERRYREATAYGYRKALDVAEMKRFHARDVGSVTRIEVAEAIAEIHSRGKERQANVTAVAVRSLFAFLGRDDQTRRSGVEAGRMDALEAPEDTLIEDDDAAGNGLLVPDGPMVGVIMRALRTTPRRSPSGIAWPANSSSTPRSGGAPSR